MESKQEKKKAKAMDSLFAGISKNKEEEEDSDSDDEEEKKTKETKPSE